MVNQTSPKKYKTIVYVDAFNLYYGVLKGTPYKWLDIDLLVKNLLKNNEIIGLKYFTAPVKSNHKNPNRFKNQKVYISALREFIPYFECINGYFKSKNVNVNNPNPPPEQIHALIPEEKGTDVNIGVEIVKDCYTKDFECIVLISNDSDLERALIIARQTGKRIIVITPLFNNWKSNPSVRLFKHADYHFRRIHPKILEKSLLPKSVDKYLCPSHW